MNCPRCNEDIISMSIHHCSTKEVCHFACDCRETLMEESMQTQRRVVDLSNQSDEGLRLRFGELNAQEIRIIRAVMSAILSKNEIAQTLPDSAGLRHEKSMKPEINHEAAETVQTGSDLAVDLPRLVRLYRNAQRKMAGLQKKYWVVNRECKRIDEEIKVHKGVRQSLLDEREKLKFERMDAGRLRATGCSYKEIAKRMGLSNPTMARNRVVQFNKTNETSAAAGSERNDHE